VKKKGPQEEPDGPSLREDTPKVGSGRACLMPLPHSHNMSVRRTNIKILTKDPDIFATNGAFLPQPPYFVPV
ncbi:MAG: hypothetical protein ACE5FM_07170, partial [Methyloligellaceae bacterium]